MLEYASVVWSPFTQSNIDKIEKVQRKAARFVFNDYYRYSSITNMPLKFAQLQSRIDLYKYSFLPRTIIDWNNLKIDNIDTINLDTFKNIIDKLNNL